MFYGLLVPGIIYYNHFLVCNPLLKIFPLSFQHFDCNVFRNGLRYIYPAHSLLKFLEACVKFDNISAFFSSIFSVLFYLILPFGNFVYIWIRQLRIVLHVTVVLLTYIFIFFFSLWNRAHNVYCSIFSFFIKRRLLLGRKVMTNLDSRDITLPTKVRLVKAMVFPVVMYGCEIWTVKKVGRQRIDAFELWC